MLTKREMRPVYYVWRFYQALNFLPFQFNTSTFLATPHQSKFRIFLFKLNLLISVAYFSFVGVQLVRSMFNPELFKLNHFPMHFIFTFFITHTPKMYNCFVSDAATTATVLNEIRHYAKDAKRSQRFHKRWTMQEMLMLTIPIMTPLNMPLFTGIFIMDPNRLQLLHSVLPEDSRNWYTLMVSILVDYYCVLFCTASITLAVFIQLGFFRKNDKIFNEMKWRETSSLSSNGEQRLREFQCFINLFNVSQRFFIYTIKTGIVAWATVLTAFGVLNLHTDAASAGLCLLVANYVAIFYINLYIRAFRVSENMTKMKVDMMVSRVQRTSSFGNLEIKSMTTMLRSIPVIGVKVGNFHQMERESVPTFLDFVTQQAVGLILTYKS